MTSQIAKEAFEFQNKLRQDPKIAIPLLEKRLKYFKGKILNLPGSTCGLSTNEGPAVYKECIEFLKKQKPLPAMKYSKGLEHACQDHCNDTGPKGITGHDGTDGSSMSDRVERYGQWQSTCGENISYGQKTGQDVILQLIVDDGVPTRGHRNNTFNPDFLVVGIATGPHKQYHDMCVLDYAGGFQEGNGTGGQKQNIAQPKQQIQQHQAPAHKGQTHNDLPEGCVGLQTSTSTSTKNGKTHTKTTKTYKFADGSTKTEISETISG